MRGTCLLLMALCSAALAAAWAADDLPILVYSCPRIQSAPTIDGRLDDPCWQTAPIVSGFTYIGENQPMPVQTFFRVAYDATGLYFAITCDEPNPERVSQASLPRDSSEIFSQEAVEIFLDPSHTQSSFYQLGINAAGSLWDSSPDQGKAWHGDIAVATTLGADAWYVEVAIPWKEIGVQPQPGQLYGFNVCRDRYIGAGREWATWARLMGSFHESARFAHLVLSPTAEQLGALGPQFRKGNRNGPIQVFTAEGFGDQFYQCLLEAALEELQTRLAALRRIAQQESQKTREELQHTIQDGEAEADNARKVLATEMVDTQTLMGLEVRLNRIMPNLNQVIWEARLQTLLSEI